MNRRCSWRFALSSAAAVISFAAAGSQAAAPDNSRTITVHYNAVVVTKITCVDGRGRQTVHRPAHDGVFKVVMAPGAGKLIYQMGETFHSVPKLARWHGVGFDVGPKGITGFGRACKDETGADLTKGQLKQAGPFTVCIGVDPPARHRGPLALSNHVQLFLDDYLVQEMRYLHRRINRPKKYADNPIPFKKEHPWEKSVMRCNTVMYDPEMKKFRMWYGVLMDKAVYEDNLGRACYAESDDGIHWRKPMMNIVDFEGRLPTNIVCKGPSGAKWGECLRGSVIKTPHDPARPYKMIFTHRQGPGGDRVDPKHYGVHVTSSPDGLHWDEPRLVVPGKHDNSPSMVYLAAEKKYLAVMRGETTHPTLGGYWRATGVSESRDYVHWSPMKTFVLTDERDPFPYTQFHDVQLAVYGDIVIGLANAMYLTEEGFRDNKDSTCNTQLVTTRNGWQWRRVADRAAFIDNGPDLYDQGFLMTWPALTIKDDTIYFYYHAGQFGMGKGNQRRKRQYRARHGRRTGRRRGGLCLATLPADRFVALSPQHVGQPGLLRTKVFTATGKNLLVNAELPEPNDLRIELLDAEGKVIPGFDRARSRLSAVDKLRYAVRWKSENGAKTFADVAGKPLAIRFVLHRGRLFALQIVP